MLRAYQRNSTPISFGSLESLELIKGPAPGHLTPTLVGGYVNFIPKSPYFDKFRGSVKVTAGRWDHYNAQFDVGGPALFLNKPSAYRFSVTGQLSDSYYDKVQNDYISLYGSIKIQLKKDLTAVIGAEYFKYKSNENVGWNRPTQNLIDNNQYVIGEPINITSPAWGGRASRNLASFPGGIFNGIQNFSALVVPRNLVDAAVADGRITAAARGALLDLSIPDDKARAYGQPLPSSGIPDPNFDASGTGLVAELATLSANTNIDGFRYTQAYFNNGGIPFTETIEGNQVLSDDNDFANSDNFIWFFDIENTQSPDRIFKNQFFMEGLNTEKKSSYGYANETKQLVISDKFTVSQSLPEFKSKINYGGSARFTYAKMLEDFAAEPFSRRDITLPEITENGILSSGNDKSPVDGLNFWSGTNNRSQLYQIGIFATAKTDFTEKLNAFTSVRVEQSFYNVGFPNEAERASDATRASIDNNGSKAYWMGSFSPVWKLTNEINLYGSLQHGTAIDPTDGGGVRGDDNFTEAELYELGLKSTFFDDRLYTTLAVYYWDQSRFNSREGRAEPLRANGIEVETTYQHNDQFTLTASFTAQRIWRRTALAFRAETRNEEQTALRAGIFRSSFVTRPTANPDLIQPGTPEVDAKIFAIYTLANGIGFGGGPTWSDGFWHNYDRTLRSPSSLIWNANIFYKSKNWDAILNIENLTSEDYYLGSEPTFAANTLVTKAQPISWKFTLTYKF